MNVVGEPPLRFDPSSAKCYDFDMDDLSPTELPAFIDFCKSLDAAVVHTPEKAVELYRSGEKNGREANGQSLAADLAVLRAQIIASGAPLLDERELDLEKAARRGERLAAE